jgi:hypothetical protein
MALESLIFSDLLFLSYLPRPVLQFMAHPCVAASRDRLLLRGAPPGADHARLLGQCGTAAERELDICGDNGARFVVTLDTSADPAL